MQFDAKKFSRLDWAIVGGAAIAFISGFLPWWGYKGSLDIYGGSISGWSAGFTAWAGVLLLTAAGVYHFLRRSNVSLPTPYVGPAVLVAGAAALGLLLVIIRWITLPSVPSALSGVIGTRYGIWFALIAGAVEVAAAVVVLRASGEPMPWAEKPAPES
jgi:hypothetical protein